MNNDTATIPYHWVKQLPAAIKNLDAIPLLGNRKSFGWAAYAQSLAETFHFQNVSIQPGIPEWISKEQSQTAASGTPKLFSLGVSPLEGNAYLLISQEEFDFFLSFVMHHSGEALSPLIQPYAEVIREYVVQEVIYLLSKGGFDSGLTPLVKETVLEPSEDYLLGLQLNVTINEKEFQPRLLLSPAFLASWRARYPLAKEPASKASIAQQTGVLAHLEIGKIILTKKEWSQVHPGDFLLFDQCSIDSKDEEKFRLMIIANGRPCFRARLKDHQLKILELPLHYEVLTPMAKQPSNEDEDLLDEDFEDEDEDFDDDEDFDFDDEDEDEDFDDEDSESHADEESHQDEESGIEEAEYEVIPAQVSPAEQDKKEVPKKETVKSPKSESSEDTDSAKPQSFETLPLTLSVEIGRLHLSTQQLSTLQPGNLLELDIRPEDGVSLVFNDKVLAKGELLRIGDVLGVRILEIG